MEEHSPKRLHDILKEMGMSSAPYMKGILEDNRRFLDAKQVKKIIFNSKLCFVDIQDLLQELGLKDEKR